MKRLLHIEASPRGERSRSGAVGQHLLTRLRADDAALTIERLDLWKPELPPFDGSVIEGRYRLLMGEAVPAEQAARWASVRRIAEHFLSFDAWLFTVPMWNFGVPYKLKQYVDLVTHPGMTFRNDALGNVEGLAAGRTAIVVAASAMDFNIGSPHAHLDHQFGYLQAWLGFIGVTDIRPLHVAPTFGAPDVVEAAMIAGCTAADVLADGFRAETVR